jgi:hypothetical protein
VPSQLSVRPRRSMESRNEGTSVPSTPVQGRSTWLWRWYGRYRKLTLLVPYSRTTSKDTITAPPRGTTATQAPARETLRSPRPSVDEGKGKAVAKETTSAERTSSSGALSGSSDSSGGPAPGQSRAFARRPQFSSPKGKNKGQRHMLSSTEEDEEDDEDAPAFLPLSSHQDSRSGARPFLGNQRATRESGPKHSPAALAADRTENGPSSSSSQSLSSPAHQSSSVPSLSSQGAAAIRSNPMATLSPRQRRAAQDGSEGTPSMGSSFSDLDDASVTQSALEEALAREMKAGKGSLGVVSRMGGLWKGQGGSSRRAAQE